MAKEKRKTFNAEGLEAFGTGIMALIKTVKDLKTKVDKYPDITDEMKTDGKAYAITNGQFDDFLKPGYNAIGYNPVQTAALKALETGVLPSGLSDEELRKVKALLGDEYFSQLEFESRENQSFEAKLEQAKQNFTAMQIKRAAEKAAMEQEAREAASGTVESGSVSSGTGSLDVEPKEKGELS